MMDIDIDQVLELIDNGFTREGACWAVAESHGHGPDSAYANALLTDPTIAATPDHYEPE